MNAPNPQARSIAHGLFTIERTYPSVTPRRVFDAFASADAKSHWFAPPSDQMVSAERTLDFRVGGRERLACRWTSGLVTQFDAVYFDIVPGERIVYAYDMHLDARKISVSIATFEFKPSGSGTTLVMTEQGAFLDGYDDNGSRERGSGELMDKLGAWLAG